MTHPGGVPSDRSCSRVELADHVGVSVIRAVRGDNSGLAGCRPCHAKRNVVGFRSAAHKHCGGERVGKPFGQAFDIVEDVLVNVSRVRVEARRLLGNGGDDPGVAVSDVRDIVVTIEITVSIPIPEPLTATAYDMDRFTIECWRIGTEKPMPPLQEFFRRFHFLSSRLFVQCPTPAGSPACR